MGHLCRNKLSKMFLIVTAITFSLLSTSNVFATTFTTNIDYFDVEVIVRNITYVNDHVVYEIEINVYNKVDATLTLYIKRKPYIAIYNNDKNLVALQIIDVDNQIVIEPKTVFNLFKTALLMPKYYEIRVYFDESCLSLYTTKPISIYERKVESTSNITMHNLVSELISLSSEIIVNKTTEPENTIESITTSTSPTTTVLSSTRARGIQTTTSSTSSVEEKVESYSSSQEQAKFPEIDIVVAIVSVVIAVIIAIIISRLIIRYFVLPR
ncbi:MAG: hypothetical protein DRO40_01175 [Thermoprotei archaeon]|nr:MAG: hypothetical protein DRO40_01175 [Thermoprotei archaeon]